MEAEITKNNKLIAKFLGYEFEYTCDVYRSGSVLKNVNLLSKIQFVSRDEVIADKDTINVESRPFIDETGKIIIGKYGEHIFYNNVVFFSIDSTVDISRFRYIEFFQQYHISYDWIMKALIKIESLNYKWEIGSADEFPYHYCKIQPITLITGISIVDAIYGAVVDFIEWYNEQVI